MDLLQPPSPLVAIHSQPVMLLTVSGPLHAAGLVAFSRHLEVILDGGVVALVLDLSGVTDCDEGLFAPITHADAALRAQRGWLGLVGLPEPVLRALDNASLPEAMVVYRAGSWSASGQSGSLNRSRSNGFEATFTDPTRGPDGKSVDR